MSDSNKNRVASSKTTRGSQYPHGYAGFDGIVQPASCNVQLTVTLDDLKAILEAGEILALALSEDEMEAFSGCRCANPSSKEGLSCCGGSRASSQYVSNSILDAEHRGTDHKEDDL